jgi:cytochrome c-type biogenesis protein CcsB
MTSRAYLLLTLGFYAVGALHGLLHALTRRRLLTNWSLTAALAGFALHTAALAQRWTEAGHFPAVGLHDGASFLAWTFMLAFLTTYVRTRVDALGLVAYPVAFVLVLVANLTPVSVNEDPVLRSLFLPVHATMVFLGYGALFVAFVMSLLYLAQERELKMRAPRTSYYLLPSLERCDTIAARSVAVGFSFLTLAILTGMLWNHAVHGLYFRGDAKEWSAVIAWTIYIVLLLARQRHGWGGRKAAFLGIAGFATVIFTFVWVATSGAPGAR